MKKWSTINWEKFREWLLGAIGLTGLVGFVVLGFIGLLECILVFMGVGGGFVEEILGGLLILLLALLVLLFSLGLLGLGVNSLFVSILYLRINLDTGKSLFSKLSKPWFLENYSFKERFSFVSLLPSNRAEEIMGDLNEMRLMMKEEGYSQKQIWRIITYQKLRIILSFKWQQIRD